MRQFITTTIFIFGIIGLQHIWGQNISLPPSGGNQMAEVSQYMGMVKVTISYSSPDVTAPNGNSRKGEIWGKLVPYGLAPNNFGSSKEIPWRAGANKNTVIEVSHDVLVQGRPLKAGTYGFHVIPSESGDWTLIFSKKNNSWGSYFYDPSEDALRVTTQPIESAYHEWLSFEFTDRQLQSCTAALMWDELAVPFTFEVENLYDLYVDRITHELEDIPGYSWQNLNQAASFCLQNNTHLEKGLKWAELAVSGPFVGQANFSTLSTKAMLEAKLEKGDNLEETLKAAMDHPTAGVLQIHQLGRQMINLGQKNEALKVFQANAEKHPDTWPVNLGLARGYSALGEYREALKYAKKSRKNVPEGDTVNKDNVDRLIKMLKKDKDIN